MATAIISGTTQFQVVERPRTRVRADSLPEHTRYRDDGCDIHPRCLTCPLPRCRYEEPGGLRALLNEYRDREIVQMRMQGMGVDELAGRFGISRRTVFRILGSKAGARAQTQVRRGDTAPVPIRRADSRKEANCA
jgi:hypothetical protein